MARVLPFVGTRYNPKVEEDLGKVVAPPYDVIDEELQDALYELSPHNIVRLILGKEEVDDDEYKNKYQRAASTLKEWKNSGVLMDDPCKNFYIYQQEYMTPDKKKHVRTGFFAAIKVEDPNKGRILGHEHTFEGPKEDRLKLLRATSCNLSPIFCLYSDPEKATDAILASVTEKEPPRMELTTADKIVHRLWLVSNINKVRQLSELLQKNDFCIADGHHRYETSVRYCREQNQMHGKRKGEHPAYTYTLAYLTNMEAEGLQILPTHRVISSELGEDVDQEEIITDLEEYFDLTPVKVDMKKAATEGPRLMKKLESMGESGTAFVMILPGGKGFYLQLKKDADITEELPESMDEDIAKLDVSILHQYIISQVWVGNPEIELDDQDVFYVKNAEDAIKMLGAPVKASAVFLMNAPKIEQVNTISTKRLRMPHKTTFFYPKLLTGMVLRDLSAPW
ncbi:MAG: DUF1015 domain-containing protein [Candidatus Sumerlaeia bacterium]